MHQSNLIRLLPALLISILPPAAVAQTPQKNPPPAAAASPANPLTDHNKFLYRVLQRIILSSAEKMPEENYGFRPTEAVRTFGQIIGHVADSQYFFCSVALGEKSPSPKVEKTKTSKAELIAALKEAFAYCDNASKGMTDASGAETVKLMRRDTPKLGVFTANSLHTIEHYGNLVTYLRMKNIVPPTSDAEFSKQMQSN